MTENAFAALGSDHRVDILRTLAVESDESGLSFTDLYDRTDIDSTSQFSYHLDRLTGVFVREGDGEYVPGWFCSCRGSAPRAPTARW